MEFTGGSRPRLDRQREIVADGFSHPCMHALSVTFEPWCAGFMLPNADDPVIWRGPRKNGLIKQFMKDVNWGEIDYLVIDSPPGTSDEHISVRASWEVM